MSITFDPVQFKSTTLAQWETAADAWQRWGPTIESWLGSATQTMLDAAEVGEGGRVLDVAAGAGGQSLVAARRVGPTGKVLATDISPTILDCATAAATEAGLSNVTTMVADGEDLSGVTEGGYDAAISRVGLIYFPDQQAALAGMCRALRPGGRVSAIVYSTADRNGFFSIPVGVIRRRAELPPPLPGQPGPFSLGSPGVAEEAFTRAGLNDITVTRIPSPLRVPTSLDCVRFERESFGALHQMLSGLDEAEREEAWAEIAQELSQFEGSQGFVGPCEMLVVTGTKQPS